MATGYAGNVLLSPDFLCSLCSALCAVQVLGVGQLVGAVQVTHAAQVVCAVQAWRTVPILRFLKTV